MSTGGDTHQADNTTVMKPFDLRIIERELRDLWKEEPQKKPTMRACVLNLLVYEDNLAEAASLPETLIDITRHHPSRLLVMTSEANSLRDALLAEVSAVCHFVPGRGKQICSEQISIMAEGSSVKRLAASVIPLFVSDLPVTLWWRGVPIDGQPFHGLAQASDRVILDSNYSRRPTAFLAILASMVRNQFKDVAFSDVNWARLTQLRSHIAGLFDLPDLRTHLRDMSQISIDYPAITADDNLPSPQTLMLLSWFATRLNWQITEDVAQLKSGVHIIKLQNGDREVVAELNPVTNLGENDLKVTLIMADTIGEQKARIIITRNYSHNAIETKLETPTICWLKNVARYEMLGEAELISHELEIVGHDTIYEAALDFAGHLVAKM